MNKEAASTFLRLLGGKVPEHQPRTGWVISRCIFGPWRHDGGESSPGVFGIKLEAGDSQCHCFSCDYHGKASDVIVELHRYAKKSAPPNPLDFKSAQEIVDRSIDEAANDLSGLYSPDFTDLLLNQKNEEHEFPSWWFETFSTWRDVKFARDYLADRGIDPEVSDYLDIRADVGERRVCFPIRGFSGKLLGLHGRAIDKDKEPRYRFYLQAMKKNPLIWLGEQWIDFEKPLVVVEGPFDLAKVLAVYPNVASPLWASPSKEKLRRMIDAQEVVTLLDTGKGGDAGRAKLVTVFGDRPLVHLRPPAGRKDPGEMSSEELIELLKPHVPILSGNNS